MSTEYEEHCHKEYGNDPQHTCIVRRLCGREVGLAFALVLAVKSTGNQCSESPDTHPSFVPHLCAPFPWKLREERK